MHYAVGTLAVSSQNDVIAGVAFFHVLQRIRWSSDFFLCQCFQSTEAQVSLSIVPCTREMFVSLAK